MTSRASLACAALTLAAFIAFGAYEGDIVPALLAGLVTAAAVAALTAFLARGGDRTLARIAGAARAIAGGRLETRVEPSPGGPAGDLAAAFNEMSASLRELVEGASRERNRLLASLNSSTDAIVAVGAEGRVAFANLAAEQLFARGQEEMLGNPLSWVLPNEPVLNAARKSAENGERETLLIERPNRQALQVLTAPIIGGGEWTALLVFHDVSDVRRAEQVRRDFVANVSHELRTPLASVKAVIETLRDGAIDDEAVAADFLSRAETEIDRLVELVTELLELSRIESGEAPMAREAVDLSSVCQRAVERLRAQAEKLGLALTFEPPAHLPAVTGDAERLERAVINLVHNAIKFTPPGGSVTVSLAANGDTVAVAVRDTGAGIAPEDLPRVFERFYKADRSRQGGGTGLGLAVVKHTAEAHGGTVTVESTQGGGSTFTLTLPVTPVAVSG